MAERVELKQTLLTNSKFKEIVDPSFKYFTEPSPVQDPDTVEELFRLYNKLFFNIPATGPNSHQLLVIKSSEIYNAPELNEEIQPLLDEIADLRERLLQANQQILNLSQQNPNG